MFMHLLWSAWDFLSTAIISFLIDGFHLRPSATARDLVITNMQVPVFRITKMAFSLILIYILISVYCEGFSYSFIILIWSLKKFKTISKAAYTQGILRVGYRLFLPFVETYSELNYTWIIRLISFLSFFLGFL